MPALTKTRSALRSAEREKLLAAAGCDYGQGYYFSTPRPPAELFS